MTQDFVAPRSSTLITPCSVRCVLGHSDLRRSDQIVVTGPRVHTLNHHRYTNFTSLLRGPALETRDNAEPSQHRSVITADLQSCER